MSYIAIIRSAAVELSHEDRWTEMAKQVGACMQIFVDIAADTPELGLKLVPSLSVSG
jgi:hypothetical protein